MSDSKPRWYLAFIPPVVVTSANVTPTRWAAIPLPVLDEALIDEMHRSALASLAPATDDDANGGGSDG